MTYNGRTWRYVRPYALFGPVWRLEVTPPEGESWTYETQTERRQEPHDGQTWRWERRVLAVGTPAGGQVSYDISGYTYCGTHMVQWPDGRWEETPVACDHAAEVRLRTRTVGGYTIAPGTWSFEYELQEDVPYRPQYVMTVTGPAYYARHKHWVQPLEVNELKIGNSSAEILERTTFEWRNVRQWPSGVWFDSFYTDRVPAFVETERDGRVYRRDFVYENSTQPFALSHFGQPTRIVETGDFARTTEYLYNSFGGAAWLADAVRETRINGVVTSEATYDNDTGFVSSQTAMGVTTSYTPLIDFSRPFTVEDLRNARGNVGALRDGNGHVTWFEYERGIVAATHTPEYSITSTINDDGTVQSTTRRGATTVFEYDSLGRETNVHPALGADTHTSYSPDGRSVTVTRGNFTTTSALDGFGRTTATENSAHVKTTTTYDAWGRATTITSPYYSDRPSEPIRTTDLEYDALGRIRKRINPDSSAITFDYGAAAEGMQVTITEDVKPGEQRHTHQLWEAPGTPATSRLKSVTDADDHTTTYSYNGLGQLTQVAMPDDVTGISVDGPVTTTFGYDDRGNLRRQTTGPTAYAYTYTTENMLETATKLVDGVAQVQYTYRYDGANQRVLKIAGSGSSRTYYARGFAQVLFTVGRGGGARRTRRWSGEDGHKDSQGCKAIGREVLSMVELPQFDQFDAEETRSLTRVGMLADSDLPNWPGVIELAFDEFTVFVCLEAEFDTLLSTRTLPESYRRSHTVVMPATFWNVVIGWTLTDAWQMRNDRGYLDAIQLRFREHPNEGSYRHIQLWAVCSSIRLLEFQVLREEPAADAPAAP